MENTQKKGRTALGRGLSALISNPVSVSRTQPASPVTDEPLSVVSSPVAAPEPASSVEAAEPTNIVPFANKNRVNFVAVTKIVNNPSQPRQVFGETELRELADSIKTHGVLQPVLLRAAKSQDHQGMYEIIAGERRWRAAQLAGLAEVPAIIHEIGDREALEIALVENIQRANLNPVEEAEAYQRLLDEFSLSQNEIAERVGKDRSSIANFLRLLKLAPEVLTMVREGKLSMGHAKAILTIKEPAAQLSLARKCLEESLSVRAVEAIVSRTVVLEPEKKVAPVKASSVTEEAPSGMVSFPETTDRLRQMLGTKVTIRHHPTGRGRIEIEYFSEQELERVVDIVCKTNSFFG